MKNTAIYLFAMAVLSMPCSAFEPNQTLELRLNSSTNSLIERSISSSTQKRLLNVVPEFYNN